MEVYMPVLIKRSRLKHLLKEIGQTQRWLANKVHVSEKRISDYANDKRPIPIEVAKNCANAIGVYIDDLFYWEEVSVSEWNEWKQSRTKTEW